METPSRYITFNKYGKTREKISNLYNDHFGASGDLTKRKLMPALYELFKDDRLDSGFSIVGVGRSEYSDEAFQAYQTEQLKSLLQMRAG